VPNVKGLHRVLHARQHGAKIDQISVFTATSDLFTQKNINMSVQASLEAFQPVIQQAKAEGLLVRGYVSTVVACPYEGLIAPQKVLEISQALFDLGVDELSLGETLGIAVPNQIDALLTLLLEHIPVNRLALHCHDTYGTALANICKALERGITSFDSASGGLGGCPYAPGASGNIATEDLLYLLQQSGLSTGIDLEGQIQASLLMEKALQQRLPSKVLQAKRASNCVT
jgi:hydroxymethylglutaryl-CoA lyase